MRRIHRSDENQAEIVKALRKCGISVEIIGRPLDLLVNHRFFCPHCAGEIPKGRTVLMDTKSQRPTSEGGSHGLTDEQSKFLARWPGERHIVNSVEQALTAALGKKVMA